MINPNMTWGDAREIYRNSLAQPDIRFEDNILADPEARKFAQGRPDNELVRKPGEFLGDVEPPAADDPESGLGETVKFYILFDDDDEAHLLVRIDDDEGTLEYRGKDQWVLVTANDEMPVLDDYPYTQVTGQAVAIWDSLEDDWSKSNFTAALLDDVDE